MCNFERKDALSTLLRSGGILRRTLAAGLLGLVLFAGIVSQSAQAAALMAGPSGNALFQSTDYPPPTDDGPTDYPAPDQPTPTQSGATQAATTPSSATQTPGGLSPTPSSGMEATPIPTITGDTPTLGPNLFQTENAQMGQSQATPANSQTVLPTMTATFFTPTVTFTMTTQPTRFTPTPSPTPRPPRPSLVNWQVVGIGIFLPLILLAVAFLEIGIYRAGYRAGKNQK